MLYLRLLSCREKKMENETTEYQNHKTILEIWATLSSDPIDQMRFINPNM